MGRKKQYDSERVATAVRIPVELHEALQGEAESRDVSVNYLIIKGIEIVLSRLTPLSTTEQELRREIAS